MTAQSPEIFYYNGNAYCLLGIAGGDLVSILDLEVTLPEANFSLGSTALHRGYVGIYGIRDDKMLIFQTVRLPDQIDIPSNQEIPINGAILFSSIWGFPFAIDIVEQNNDVIYEAVVKQGIVERVTDITSDVIQGLKSIPEDFPRGSLADSYHAQMLDYLLRQQKWIATVLSRQYDLMYVEGYFVHFPSEIARIQDKLNK